MRYFQGGSSEQAHLKKYFSFPLLRLIFSYFVEGCTASCMRHNIMRYFSPTGPAGARTRSSPARRRPRPAWSPSPRPGPRAREQKKHTLSQHKHMCKIITTHCAVFRTTNCTVILTVNKIKKTNAIKRPFSFAPYPGSSSARSI